MKGVVYRNVYENKYYIEQLLYDHNPARKAKIQR